MKQRDDRVDTAKAWTCGNRRGHVVLLVAWSDRRRWRRLGRRRWSSDVTDDLAGVNRSDSPSITALGIVALAGVNGRDGSPVERGIGQSSWRLLGPGRRPFSSPGTP